MNQKEIEEAVNRFWDLAIESMHKTSPKAKNLPTTSGKLEEALDVLYNKHRENQLELFEGLHNLNKKRK